MVLLGCVVVSRVRVIVAKLLGIVMWYVII